MSTPARRPSSEPARPFAGFKAESFAFLSALGALGNNNKSWFNAHREQYEVFVKQPMAALVSSLGPSLLRLDPRFEVRPLTNKTLTRINRDMRFARGLPPYKDHVLALFYRVDRKQSDAQLFVGLQPTGVWSGLYVGGHLVAAPAKRMARDGWAGLGRECGVGRRFRLCVCERYGEVARVVRSPTDSDYLSGPHLVMLRAYSVAQSIRLGPKMADDLVVSLRALFPLWRRYSHA